MGHPADIKGPKKVDYEKMNTLNIQSKSSTDNQVPIPLSNITVESEENNIDTEHEIKDDESSKHLQIKDDKEAINV